VNLVSWCGGPQVQQYFLNINKVAQNLTPEKCKGLSLLYTFTGCDYVEGFFQYGKKSWFDAYMKDETIHETFSELTRHPEEVLKNDLHLKAVERFVLTVYKLCPDEGLALGRLDLLIHKTIDKVRLLPPSYEALRQHLYRSVYVAGCLWGKAWQTEPECPDPINWGWFLKGDTLFPLWTTLVINHKIVTDALFYKCSCSKKCPDNPMKVNCTTCQCLTKDRSCIGLCGCRGECCKCEKCTK